MKRLGTFLIVLVAALLGLLPTAQAQTCAPPTNVQVSSVGSPGNNTAVISFTPSATAVSYTVRYFWVGDSTVAGIMSVNTTTSPVTLTGLRTGSGAYYRVSVVSNCAGGFTTGSPWVGFGVGGSGGPGPGGCGAVTGLSLSSNPTATYVTFQPVSGALSYTVRFQVVGDSASVRTVTVSSSPATFSGSLLPATQYIATVVTNCGNGTTTPTTSVPASIQFTTPPAAGTCGTVSNVLITAITDTTAIVSFTPVAGATSYFLRVASSGLGGQYNATVTGSPVLVTGLSRGLAYNVSITTNCPNGTTSAVVRSTFTTTNLHPIACGVVTNVTVTATSSSTATLSFTPGAGNVRYSIFYSSPAPAPDSLWAYTTASPATLTGLVPGHTYTIRVVGYCGTGSNATSTNNTPIVFSFRGALATRAALGTGTVEVFPNPAHHAASLVLPAVSGVAQAQLTLLNALGQAVRSQTIALLKAGETRTQLDLANVPPGLYTLRVAAGGQTASQRLAVE